MIPAVKKLPQSVFSSHVFLGHSRDHSDSSDPVSSITHKVRAIHQAVPQLREVKLEYKRIQD
jgi:hypothetical protein